jgi:hypothetical protein
VLLEREKERNKGENIKRKIKMKKPCASKISLPRRLVGKSFI